MNERPNTIADADHDEQRQRRSRRRSCRCSASGDRVRLAGRLLDDDRPAERRDARGDAELAAARPRRVYSAPSACRLSRPGPRPADGSLMLRACATSAFLSGSPCAISSPSGATTSAKPCSPMRMRSTMRHISSRLNSPTSQPDGLVQAREVDGEHRRRQQIVVDADRRHRDAVDDRRRVLRDRRRAARRRGSRRRAAPASSNSVISRNSRNCEDVVLEDAILLPLLEAGVLQVGGERLQQCRRCVTT